MEMLTSCKGFHIHQYVIGGTGLYWNMGTSSICHAYSTVSITSKEFTKLQIVLRTWNPSVKLEIHCAFIRSPINCICNIDFLWSKFPVTILYSLSSKVIQRMGVFDKLIQCTMPILSSIPSTCIIPRHLFWAIVLLIIIRLLFRVDVLKFCRYMVIGNQLTHIFRRKYDPSQSIHLNTYNLEMLKQISMLADKSTPREAMLLFWDEDIAFLGHTKWSTKHNGNNQRRTVKDTQSQVLEAVNISAPVPPPSPLNTPPPPPPPLSLSLSRSLHAGADTQALFTQCLPVECIVFSFFYSDTHWSLSTQ